jgi:hypothetical protein
LANEVRPLVTRHHIDRSGNGCDEGVAASRGRLSEACLHLGEDLLDRVEVGL